MSTLAKNNFNQYKTLKELGYSESTALNDAKSTIDRAIRVVNESLQLNTTDKVEVAQKSYEILGLTKEQVANRIRDIVLSNDNTNALKILQSISKDIGLNLTDQENQKAPSVNITVEKVETNTDTIRDIEAS